MLGVIEIDRIGPKEKSEDMFLGHENCKKKVTFKQRTKGEE